MMMQRKLFESSMKYLKVIKKTGSYHALKSMYNIDRAVIRIFHHLRYSMRKDIEKRNTSCQMYQLGCTNCTPDLEKLVRTTATSVYCDIEKNSKCVE